MDIPPSGKQVAQRGLAIYRVEGGNLVEAWAAEPSWQQTLTDLAASS
jgi:predicted ester cyclase